MKESFETLRDFDILQEAMQYSLDFDKLDRIGRFLIFLVVGYFKKKTKI